MDKLKRIGIEDMLAAREERAVMLYKLWQTHRETVIMLTLNIKGDLKDFPLARKGFAAGCKEIARKLSTKKNGILYMRGECLATGCEGYFVVKADPKKSKKLMMQIEENHPLGRIFDIDVHYDGSAVKGSEFGREFRKCIVCGKPVWACARSGAHGDEVIKKTEAMLSCYFKKNKAEKDRL